MKIAYLFFAYKNPELIKKTIARLTDETCSFYLHIDKKSDIRQFEVLRSNNVFFTSQRMAVYWAEFSGVEAILLLIREALAAPQHYDYFVLLSGSEYPLRSKEYIKTVFRKASRAGIYNDEKDARSWEATFSPKYVEVSFTQTRFQVSFRALTKLGLARRDYRKHFGGLEPYSGLTWWALTRDACDYVVDFEQRDRTLAKFFRNVFAPEETFFHTILGNSAFRSRLRRNLVYEDWSEEGGHPAMIDGAHCTVFETQEKVCVQDLNGPGELLFARKFSDENLQLTQRIDAMISHKDGK